MINFTFLSVCRSQQCPATPTCSFNERKERVNSDTACCGVYVCKRKSTTVINYNPKTIVKSFFR